MRYEIDTESAQLEAGAPFTIFVRISNPGAQPPGPGPIVLQPGNTAIKKFAVKTRQVTLFSPAQYTFHIEIHYEIDGKPNQDAVKQQFTIHAPLKASVNGSCWGALAGASLHGLKDHVNNYAALWGVASIAAPIAGILIGAVIVIAFARKKDSQPFISIEDFYGGCFVGFVAGYTGFPILDTILPK